MRFLTARELRNESARVWRELPAEREMVVTHNGKPVAVLASVGEDDLDSSLAAFRRLRAVEAVAAMQRDAVADGRDALTATDIDSEIAAVRRESRQ